MASLFFFFEILSIFLSSTCNYINRFYWDVYNTRCIFIVHTAIEILSWVQISLMWSLWVPSFIIPTPFIWHCIKMDTKRVLWVPSSSTTFGKEILITNHYCEYLFKKAIYWVAMLWHKHQSYSSTLILKAMINWLPVLQIPSGFDIRLTDD